MHQTNRNFSTGTGKHGGVVPRSIPPVPSKPRVTNGPQARDPRLARESIAEFAEFIRSTGPPGASSASVAGTAGPAKVRNPGSVSNISVDTGRTSTTSNPNRPKLQPRGAAVDHKDDNSDLIDFIRRGPPSSTGNPRIPRTVAPFRTTMDSDQLSSAVGGRAVDAQLKDIEFRGSQASTNATESSVPPSVQSSINSHSALLAKNNPMSYDTTDGDMKMPQRKTRRNLDPYAIDLSDEEDLEDDEMPAPLPKKRGQAQEESLIDFLNNYAPPPEPTVQPFNIKQTRNTSQPKKKASASSLMARFTRRDSTHSSTLASASSASPKLPESRSINSRASGAKAGHVPIQVNVPSAATNYVHPARTSSKAAAMMGGGPGSTGGRVPMKRFEPREAASIPSRETSDLADFLKNSAPPPGVTNPFRGPAERDETNGISKVFGRRKKPSIS